MIAGLALIDSDLPSFEIPLALIAGVTAASAAFLFLFVGMAVRGRRSPVVSGREDMLGARAEALEDFESEGWIRVRGETWRAVSSRPVRRGQNLRVRSIDGLRLLADPEAD